MKQFTLSDLRKLGPCYDPGRYLSETWCGTALDILDVKAAPFPDRLWMLMYAGFFSEKFIRLYAVWCARQVQHLMQDERSIRALDVAEAFANGTVTRAELWAANDAARAASWDAPKAAKAALWATAWDARDAANDAAKAALWAASDDASAAWDAAMDAQENRLREMITAGIETGEVK